MPRFFTTEIEGETAFITGEDAKHISRVLRMSAGDALTVSDGTGYDYDCVLEFADTDRVGARILRRYRNRTEPDVRITLYQALPKGDKLDFIIQKAVELGVTEIVPVLTKRCVSRPDPASFSKKLPRYQRIAAEAAKQCGRGIIPPVREMLSLEQALGRMADAPLALVFYEGGGARVSELFRPQTQAVSLLIGSEGGFAEEEIASCNAAGLQCATLGRRILRCETAPLAALTLIHTAAGEM